MPITPILLLLGSTILVSAGVLVEEDEDDEEENKRSGVPGSSGSDFDGGGEGVPLDYSHNNDAGSEVDRWAEYYDSVDDLDALAEAAGEINEDDMQNSVHYDGDGESDWCDDAGVVQLPGRIP